MSTALEPAEPRDELGFLRDPLGLVAERLQRGEEVLGTNRWLAEELKQALRWQALDLCRRGAGPADTAASPRRFIEEQILGQRGNRRAWRKLLVEYETLIGPTGWQRDASLMTWLVGIALAQGAVDLRGSIGRDRRWAEAAEVAVTLGDPQEAWLVLQEQEAEPLWIIERTLVTVRALGAARVPLQSVAKERQQRLFEMAVSLLIWLAPANDPRPQDNLFLGPHHWEWLPFIRAMARWQVREQLPGAFCSNWRAPAPPLGPVMDALALPLRLTEEEVERVLLLCAPGAAAREGRLDASFWAWTWRGQGQAYLPAEPQWIALAARCLDEDGGVASARLMVTLAAPALLQSSPGQSLWLGSLQRLATEGHAEDLLQAFTKVLDQIGGGGVRDSGQLLQKTRQLLQGLGVWAQAQALLRERMPEQQWLLQLLTFSSVADLLAVLEGTKDELARLVDGWTAVEYLPSQVVDNLQAAGISTTMLRLRAMLNSGSDSSVTLGELIAIGGSEAWHLVGKEIRPIQRQALATLPPGPWLATIPIPAGPEVKDLLRHLAIHGRHPEVRRACLKGLVS